MKEMILVTGGTGFIGSHTAVELMEAGYEVVIIDDLSNSNEAVLDGIKKITGKKPLFEKFDLCNLKLVDDFFKQYNTIKAIIHFAAKKAVPESIEKPLLYYENNLVSLINLFKLMLKSSIRYFVFSSSCTVYGDADELPVTEKTPMKKANSPYGNTKQISEEIIEDIIAAGHPVKAVSLRYFNPIGAHPSGFIGELPVGIPSNLVPFITQTAFGIHPELMVYGNNYNTPDGTCIRDYIDVVDLSKAHIKAIERLLPGKMKSDFEIFNLGTGKGVSVFEMIHVFEKATNVKLKFRVTGRREGDVEQIWADTSYANKELGWKAETSLEDTLRSAWKWEKYYRNQSK
ncbi:MAG: UDP-galactose-4-epimerase [Bacteroides sp. SM23_62_1]|nr:MAG: UDP-galactose-4-epimerase [Bacteroides sp. SM23_62_1]